MANAALVWLAIGTAVLGVVLSRRALKALGSNWNFVAGVGPHHRLVTDGPYAVLRHPLYTGFFLLTFSTAIVWSDLVAFPWAGILFVAGVCIRIRTEEKLLREVFGSDFESYVRRVRAFWVW